MISHASTPLRVMPAPGPANTAADMRGLLCQHHLRPEVTIIRARTTDTRHHTEQALQHRMTKAGEQGHQRGGQQTGLQVARVMGGDAAHVQQLEHASAGERQVSVGDHQRDLRRE